MDSQDLEKVRETSLFNGMPDAALREIVGNEPARQYPKGKVLFQQEDEASHFYIVLEGWVKLYRLWPSGEEVVMNIFTEGESFAEAAMFGDRRYPATAEVVSDARLIAVNCSIFESKMAEDSKIAMHMIAATMVHMKQLVMELEQVKGRSSAQRVAFFLLKLCPKEKGSALVYLPYEKALVASRLGIQPESLSRALNKLRGFGVNCVKNKVIISDIEELRELATGEH